MRVHCTNCGRDGHAKWQCTRPTKSGASPRAESSKPESDTLGKVASRNPSSRKGSGVESLRTPTEGRKGRDSTSGGARAKLRDPSAVLTQTAAQPPVGTNSNPVQDAKALTANTEATVAPEPAQGVQIPRPGPPTKRPRGRPRIHPDRKAYKAQWERDKRKRMKDANAKQG